MKYFIQEAGYKGGVLAVKCEFEAVIPKELEDKMVEVDLATFDTVKANPLSYSIKTDGTLERVKDLKVG